MPTMKNKRRRTGPGDRATDRFRRCVAALEPTVKRGARVSDARKAEIAHVEKQAAVVLCNPPVVYSMPWPGRRAGKLAKTVLRLSVGLSLSIGVPHFRRYVVTLARGARRAVYEEGTILPADASAKATLLTALPSWTEERLPILTRGVAEACEQYQSLPGVQDALRRIGERRRAELAGLEHLYARRQRSEGRIHGLPEPGTTGSASIEVEQRKLQRIVLERYAVRVRVRILSLGLLTHTGV